MKTITCIVLLFFCVFFSFAQEKGVLGVYTEGAWFIPGDKMGSINNGLAAGAGLYYEFPISTKFSGSLGVGYRFKQNKKYQINYTENYGGYSYGYQGVSYYISGYEGYSPYGYNPSLEGKWLSFPQHYVVLPARLKYKLKKDFFIQTGLEAAWLLGYDYVSQKPEFSWSVGFGSKVGDLEWSLSYMQGTKEQGMVNYENSVWNVTKDQNFRNRMIMLNLSYPLWKR